MGEMEIAEGLFMVVTRGGYIFYRCNHEDKKRKEKREEYSLCKNCEGFIFGKELQVLQLAKTQ